MGHLKSNIDQPNNDIAGEDQEKIQQVIQQISVSPDVKSIGESIRQSTLQKINRRIDLSSRRIVALKVAAVAASIIFLLGITNYFSYHRGYIQQNSQWVELANPLGTKSTITLSDGTKVIMNAGTTIRYPSVFTSADREVEITGEAFFDVAHDAKHSFLVKAGQVNVRVFGTKFNVKSYQNDDQIEVTLDDGSIGIKLDHLAEIIRMTPNEQIVFNKSTRHITKHQVNVAHFVAWREGKYYFRNVSFEEIVKQLERTFDVHIFINSDKLKKTSFTGDFVHKENLEQILRVMTIDKRITYKIEGDRIFISEQ